MSQTPILIAIKHLVEEGKQPTLALLKSRVSERLPMPLFIAAINSYKRNPSVIDNLIPPPESTCTQNEIPSEAERCDQLEQRVAQLEQQLAASLQRIEALERTCI